MNGSGLPHLLVMVSNDYFVDVDVWLYAVNTGAHLNKFTTTT